MLTEEEIQNAVLMSMFSKRPVHVNGEWFVWGDSVMPKRMLLAILMASHGQYITAHAANAVIGYYAKVEGDLPKKHKLQLDEFASPNTMLLTLAGRIVDKLHPSKANDDDFLSLSSKPNVSLAEVQQMIIEVFGNVYEDNTETV